MIPRSLLFVPGDSERKLAKGAGSPADALILDLEDSVAAERLPTARGMVREYLKAHADRARQALWVRVNPLDGGKTLADLAAVVEGAPDGILLPKTDSAAEVVTVGHYLAALETRADLPVGGIQVISVATETAMSLFRLDSYVGASPRLAGITWGAEDLAAALGASTNKRPDGSYAPVFQLARTLCLAAAVAAEIQPLDTVFTNFRDPAGLEAEARTARQDGFTGKLAIHPDQVPIINAAFTPSPAEVEEARRIVALFDANPGAGTLSMDGRMLDRPHLTQAHRVLATAERAAARG